MNDQRNIVRLPSEIHEKFLHQKYLIRLDDLLAGKITKVELAKQLAEEWGKLEQERIRDPLTGAFNRGLIGAVLEQELAMTEVTNSHVGFIMLDLDHFKSINDQEPDRHSAGDRALISFVKILKETCGPTSLVGRLGGEEFAVIVQDVDFAELQKIAKDIGQRTGAELAQLANLTRSQVTVSIGGRMASAEDRPSALMLSVDQLLYKAKEGGRNRMVVQNPQGQEDTVEFSA